MARTGRPSFKPTAKQRRSVEQMASVGEKHDVIARAIGVSDETLRKHFDAELRVGPAKRRQEVLEILYKAARNGNVSAAKRIEEMTRIAGAAAAIEDIPEPSKPDKLGKKAQTMAAAERVEATFAPPSQPKLVVSNN